eukprot:COSAG05_NODE_15895_length_358_cov_1.386100_1_plen_41_part_01
MFFKSRFLPYTEEIVRTAQAWRTASVLPELLRKFRLLRVQN